MLPACCAGCSWSGGIHVAYLTAQHVYLIKSTYTSSARIPVNSGVQLQIDDASSSKADRHLSPFPRLDRHCSVQLPPADHEFPLQCLPWIVSILMMVGTANLLQVWSCCRTIRASCWIAVPDCTWAGCRVQRGLPRTVSTLAAQFRKPQLA